MELEEFQKGNDSTMTSLQRLDAHTLWLEKIHKEIKKTISKKKINETETYPIQGFPKDDEL